MNQQDTKYPQYPWLPAVYFENRHRFPRERLKPYSGMHIAWSWEGDRIVGSAADKEELWRHLTDEGIDPHHVVFEFIEDYQA